ncbi:MAG: HSP90 family protein [Renibacterium salmoninarum]|nr:HSP90 family protein [Renibacterium salmoninarum]
MNQDSVARPFQVDLRGVVDLLSRHIYSSPQVFLRELLQNGVDAVAARRLQDPAAPEGRLEIDSDGELLTVRDNGVGLTLDEATQLLATVGRSSKRDSVLNLRREDFLGQFGIGLLSCFLIADEIRVVSRSAFGSRPVEWIGSTEGSFTLRSLDDPAPDGKIGDRAVLPVGTTVYLRPRATEAAIIEPGNIRRLAAHFGEYLALRISVAGEPINKAASFLDPAGPPEEILALGTDLLGATPLDWIPLDIPGTGTRGIAYLLPTAPPPSAHQANRVYLGRMLLGERIDSLLPDWAFFVRCILDTDGLQPTASREQLVEDASLEFTREELGKTLKRWIVQLATTQQRRFDQFLSVHQLSLRALSLHDDELAAVIVPWLSVETAAGRMPIRALLESGGTLRYTETTDEFRQIAAVVPPGMPVLNGGYAYESELIRRFPELNPQIQVERIRVAEVLDELAAPALADRDATAELERRAERALAEAGCKVSVRNFNPEHLPALYVADPEVLRRIERSKASDVAPSFWAGIMANVDEQLGSNGKRPDDDRLRSRLCLNWANPLTRELAGVDDELVFERTVRLLYVQAMLEGHRPLAAVDRKLLSGSLSDLIQLSVSPDFGPIR